MASSASAIAWSSGHAPPHPAAGLQVEIRTRNAFLMSVRRACVCVCVCARPLYRYHEVWSLHLAGWYSLGECHSQALLMWSSLSDAVTAGTPRPDKKRIHVQLRESAFPCYGLGKQWDTSAERTAGLIRLFSRSTQAGFQAPCQGEVAA